MPALSIGMLTLVAAAQTRGRIPIRNTDIPLVISGSGSYFLVEDINYAGTSDAITIQQTGLSAADSLGRCVTIDLEGHVLRGPGTASGGNAIYLNSTASPYPGGITVTNGTITGWRGSGILASNDQRLRISDVKVSNTGQSGIDAGYAQVERVTVSKWGQVSPLLPGLRVLTGSITDALVHDGSGDGILCYGGSVLDSLVFNCSSNGIIAGNSTVERCKVFSCTKSGIYAQGNVPVVSNIVLSNGSSDVANAGIFVNGYGNVVEDNIVTSNSRGIALSSSAAANRVGRNTVYSNAWVPSGGGGSQVDNYAAPANGKNELVLNWSEGGEAIDFPCTIKFANDVGPYYSSHGLIVQSDNVTIDLNGFTLLGAAGSFDGINVPNARKDLVVKNGTIRGWGNSGAWCANVTGARFENVEFRENGQTGLIAGPRAHVVDCKANNNGTNGFILSNYCEVTNCQAIQNTQRGFAGGSSNVLTGCVASNNQMQGFQLDYVSRIVDCVADANSQEGFLVSDGNTLSGCSATSNLADGFELNNGNSLTRCTARSNRFDGIRAGWSNQIVENLLDGNGNGSVGASIHLTGSQNRVDSNNCVSADYGLDVDVGGNAILRNTCRGNGDNYGQIVGGNDVGPIGTLATSTSPWANISY
jgi:parallel beta-helix repeat protein